MKGVSGRLSRNESWPGREKMAWFSEWLSEEVACSGQRTVELRMST